MGFTPEKYCMAKQYLIAPVESRKEPVDKALNVK
jgi:hypothetical protein